MDKVDRYELFQNDTKSNYKYNFISTTNARYWNNLFFVLPLYCSRQFNSRKYFIRLFIYLFIFCHSASKDKDGDYDLAIANEILADGMLYHSNRKDPLEITIGDGMEFTIHGSFIDVTFSLFLIRKYFILNFILSVHFKFFFPFNYYYY